MYSLFTDKKQGKMIVNCCVGIMQSVSCCVGVLLLVNCCVAELVRKPWYHQRSMTDGTIFRGGSPLDGRAMG